MDSFLINDLMYDFKFPPEFQSDMAKIGYFTRKNNISFDDLYKELQNFNKTFKDQGNDKWKISIFLDATKKILDKQKFIVDNPNLNVLSAELSGGSYGALMVKNAEGNWIIRIMKKAKDDAFGNSTGVPNIEYWEGTPGSYYATTILGVDSFSYSQKNDKLCLDGGSNWCIYGMDELRKELEEKYGDELRSEVKRRKENLENILSKSSGMAKKVHENLSKWMSY